MNLHFSESPEKIINQDNDCLAAIANMLGRNISYEEACVAWEQVANGTNNQTDLHEVSKLICSSDTSRRNIGDGATFSVPAVKNRLQKNLFSSTAMFTHVDIYVGNVVSYQGRCALPDKHKGQPAGKIYSFTVSGATNTNKLAAELLGVNQLMIPVRFLQKMLRNRNHVFTLPVIEQMIIMQSAGTHMGFGECVKSEIGETRYRLSTQVFFIETTPGVIELLWVRRITPTTWSISRFPFDAGDTTSHYDCLETRVFIRT
jgi:hypothetical protein